MSREALIFQLTHLLGQDRVINDPAELFVYESDGFTIAKARPAAVVFPGTTEDVVKVVQLLNQHDVPIIPRGSGTGLAGGCVAFENGVIISTSKMTRILSIDLDNRVAQVQAGVRNTQLSDAVSLLPLGTPPQSTREPALTPWETPAQDPTDAHAGEPSRPNRRGLHTIPNPYHFAPDPSSQRASTIGGNAATNAGGIHTLKDFVSSNHVLGIEMVLPDATILTVGGQNGSYESGPFDLPGLICGSEGTFGIITSLWVRLVPKATAFRTLVATFSSTSDACNTVSDIIASGILPAAMEMMDGEMIKVVEDAFHFGFPREAAAMLLIEIDGLQDLLDGYMNDITQMCTRHRAMNVEQSSDPNRRAQLWKARKSAFGAIGRISPSYCTQDACVPRSMLAQVLERINEIGREFGLHITNVFHAGDGNVHPIFLYNDRDPAQVQNTLKAAEKILKYCIDVGGTLTGEHGVGVEKLHLMPHLFDRPTLAQFHRTKEAFDPHERINAGKLIASNKVKVELLKPGRKTPQ